jgi:hypothetical protein
MPAPKTRKLRFSGRAGLLQGLLHKLKRWSAHMARLKLGVKIMDFYIELARREAALLQYSICVDIEADDNATGVFENAVAVAVVRLIFEYLTVGQADRDRTLRMVDSLRRINAKPGTLRRARPTTRR